MLKDYVRIDTASYDPEGEGFSYNPPSDEMTPEENAIFEELRDHLMDTINTKLSDNERHALTLRMSGVPVKDGVDFHLIDTFPNPPVIGIHHNFAITVSD